MNEVVVLTFPLQKQKISLETIPQNQRLHSGSLVPALFFPFSALPENHTTFLRNGFHHDGVSSIEKFCPFLHTYTSLLFSKRDHQRRRFSTPQEHERDFPASTPGRQARGGGRALEWTKKAKFLPSLRPLLNRASIKVGVDFPLL